MPVDPQILHHAFERRPAGESQFFVHIVAAKINGSVIPACKRKSAITQNYLAGGSIGMDGDGLRVRRHDRFDLRPSLSEKRF